MERERWARIEALFQAAIDLDPAARDEFLTDECGPDRDLRREVVRLLSDEERSRDLVTRLGVMKPDDDETEDHLVGRRVGNYQLEERIAAGGMGLVYRARRADGVFEQQVAVKLIRAETATPEMRARFEFERRALAALQHPHIAQLFDGGTTDDGTPYLVMELIDGSPIDAWCEQQRVSVAARLRIFVQVCRTVHYAHQNLIIHRDLKPGNVMIDREGTPKLLDFGIARLLDDTDQVARVQTRTLARVLTPEYASPEQLRGESLTTASDVYSLGIVLYGMLTGEMPFRCDSRSVAEWERLVTEREPTRPSTAVTTGARSDPRARDRFATTCGSTPQRLRRELRGDLDRIVLMALRKDPARRYASAEQFATDVERHLNGLPVSAREDSFLYRTRKFVGRNRLVVASAALVILALVAGIVSTWRVSREARHQAAHAGIEAESFRHIGEFLLDTFLISGTLQHEGERSDAISTITRQAARVRIQFADQNHLRANLLDALGGVCGRLSFHDDAESLMNEALEIRKNEFETDSLEVALSLTSLGRLRYDQRSYDEARDLLTRALELHRANPHDVHTNVPAAANDLACVLRASGDLEGAAALHREALALRLAADGAESLPVAESRNNLAGVYLDLRRNADAARELRLAVRAREAVLGAEHALTLQSRNNLAIALAYEGETAAAAVELDAVVAAYRALRAAGKEGLARTLANVSVLRQKSDQPSAALDAIEEAIVIQEERLGRDHPLVAKLRARRAEIRTLAAD